MDIVFLIALGIIGGLIAGMLGLGGGIFYILIFPYLMISKGFTPELIPQLVIANSLFGIMVASGISIVGYQRKGIFPWKEILFVGISASIISVLSLNLIVLQPWFSKIVFNSLVILLMIYILLKMYLDLKLEKKEDGKITNSQSIASGGIAGFVSALSGLGGGIIVIPLLTLRFRVPLLKAKTISLAMIFISSTTMTINNLIAHPDSLHPTIYTIGYIVPSCIIPISVGVVFGSMLGVRWSTQLSRKALDVLFMIFVLLVLIEKSIGLFNSSF